jgi:hypothetical protein
MNNTEKIETILRHDYIQWQTMSHNQLLNLLIENRRFFLETEIEYGNDDYLDELLEEVNIPEVWATVL